MYRNIIHLVSCTLFMLQRHTKLKPYCKYLKGKTCVLPQSHKPKSNREYLQKVLLNEKTEGQRHTKKRISWQHLYWKFKLVFRRRQRRWVSKELISGKRMFKKAEQLGDTLLNKTDEAQKQLEKLDFSSEAQWETVEDQSAPVEEDLHKKTSPAGDWSWVRKKKKSSMKSWSEDKKSKKKCWTAKLAHWHQRWRTTAISPLTSCDWRISTWLWWIQEFLEMCIILQLLCLTIS